MRPTREVTFLAMLLGAGIIVQALEALYLPPLMIPGAKLGLANAVTLVLIVFFGWKDVLIHVVLRVSAVALVTGTFISTTFFYSLFGGLGAACVMILFYRYMYGPFSYAGVSLAGAVTHNLIQLALAVFMIGHIGIVALLPWLIFMAVVSGLPNGLLVNMLEPRLKLIDRELHVV